MLNPFDPRWYFLTPALPILSLIGMWGIHKLLNKFVPIPTKDEILKDIEENDDGFEILSEKKVKESRENLINFEKPAGKISNGRFKPSWFFLLLSFTFPTYAPMAHLLQFSYHVATKPNANSTDVSLCNNMDSEIFHKFLASWKENNEAQKKLNQWQINVGDNETSDMIKEYFAQRIQNATEIIKVANATLEPQFQIYKECFITKQNEILIYCFGSWLFLYISMTVACSIAVYSFKYMKRVDDCADRYIDFDTYFSQKIIKFSRWFFKNKKIDRSDKSFFKTGVIGYTIMLIWYGPFYFWINRDIPQLLMAGIPREFLY